MLGRRGTDVTPIGDVRLSQRGLELARAHGGDVLDRALSRLGDGDQAGDAAAPAMLAITRAWCPGESAGEDAADLEIGPGGRGGADAEELQLLERRRQPRAAEEPRDQRQQGRAAQ